MKDNNIRSCIWCLVLYPQEDPTHKKALDYIKLNYTNYAFIEHDSDTNDDGSFIKPHTHVVLKFKNYRWRNSIALELGITPNYLEKCFNLDKALLYLIHFEDYSKFQYSIDKVQATPPLKQKLTYLISNIDSDDNDSLLQLLSFIDNYPNYLSMSNFLHWVTSTTLLTIYKKYYFCINQCIKEHNLDFVAGRL